MGDGAVLVHLATNHIFELNGTGARIWDLLAEGTREDRIIELLVSEFQVDADEAARSFAELVDRLRAEGLLQG